MDNKRLLFESVEWDIVNWSKAFRFWANHADLDSKKLICLELGGRKGGISLWLASKGNKVICSDLQNPSSQAGALHAKYGMSQYVAYESMDATNIPYENYFDVIAFKSILGGISRNNNQHLNKVVIEQVHKALKPGGQLLFAENLKASRIHQFFRKRFTNWGKYWNYLQLDDMNVLFHNFEVNYETAGFFGAFGVTEWQRRILGTLDTLIMDRIAPAKTRYIIYGVASKSPGLKMSERKEQIY